MRMTQGTRHPRPDRSRQLDLLCFSHLRWHFVFQRPQHLMTRCARDRRVFFIEEPVQQPGADARLAVNLCDGVHVVVPHLPEGTSEADAIEVQRRLLADLIDTYEIAEYIL